MKIILIFELILFPNNKKKPFMGHQTVQWIDTSLIFGHKMIQFAITQIGNIINYNYGLLIYIKLLYKSTQTDPFFPIRTYLGTSVPIMMQ
jgi:hypothetical protein